MTDREKSNGETIVVTEQQPENGQKKLTKSSTREPPGSKRPEIATKGLSLKVAAFSTLATD